MTTTTTSSSHPYCASSGQLFYDLRLLFDELRWIWVGFTLDLVIRRGGKKASSFNHPRQRSARTGRHTCYAQLTAVNSSLSIHPWASTAHPYATVAHPYMLYSSPTSQLDFFPKVYSQTYYYPCQPVYLLSRGHP